MKSTFGLTMALFYVVAVPCLAQQAPFDEGRTPSDETTLSAAPLTCDDIVSYCYSMWIIRRHNYEQYVGCVLTNAENNGLSCRP